MTEDLIIYRKTIPGRAPEYAKISEKKNSTDFRTEWKVLLAVTFSGLIYNLGLLAGPWFEGK